MESTNLEKLCEYLSNRVKLYPIKNKTLLEETGYIKQEYMKMLAVMLQQKSNDITDAQLSTFKRIIAGAEMEDEAADYLRMAMQIEIEDFLSFIGEMKNQSLKYRFIIDAIILVGLGRDNWEQFKMIVEFADSLGINKEELEYLAVMAKAVISMDADSYKTLYLLETESVPKDILQGYSDLLSVNCLVCNDDATVFRPSCVEEVTEENIGRLLDAKSDSVQLINASVNLEEISLFFSDKMEVKLAGCNFIGGLKYPVSFRKCQKIIIENCCFKGFKSRTMEFQEVKDVYIYNSVFDECEYNYSEGAGAGKDWKNLGGVLYFKDKDCKVYIDECKFESCGGKNSQNYYKDAFIANAVCSVNNSRFNNCWHYTLNAHKTRNNRRCRMFASGSKATGCTFENSAEFC